MCGWTAAHAARRRVGVEDRTHDDFGDLPTTPAVGFPSHMRVTRPPGSRSHAGAAHVEIERGPIVSRHETPSPPAPLFILVRPVALRPKRRLYRRDCWFERFVARQEQDAAPSTGPSLTLTDATPILISDGLGRIGGPGQVSRPSHPPRTAAKEHELARRTYHSTGAVSFSTKGEYGVRLMAQLARPRARAGEPDRHRRTGSPAARLPGAAGHQPPRRRAGPEHRGAHGGYELTRPPEAIRMSEVLEPSKAPSRR